MCPHQFLRYLSPIWYCWNWLGHEFASRGSYIQSKGHHIGLQKYHGQGPVNLALKAVGPYMEPLFHNNGHIFQELLSLHLNLRHKVVMNS